MKGDFKMNSLVKYIGDEVQIEKIKDSAKLKSILNSGVNQKWLKNHPTAKNVKYLPIDKIEILHSFKREKSIEFSLRDFFKISNSFSKLLT